jgi:hypothetical protein
MNSWSSKLTTAAGEGPRWPARPEGLDDLAARINAMYRDATLDVTYSIGELIIRELYDGQVDLWGHHGTQRASYRQLAARGDLLLSPSALCRAVAIYVLCARTGGRATFRHLSASHLQEVLALEASQQESLLRTAEAQRWTVARLRAEVQKKRPPSLRSKRARLMRTLAKLRAMLDENKMIFADPHAFIELDERTATECLATLAEVSAQLDALTRKLGST